MGEGCLVCNQPKEIIFFNLPYCKSDLKPILKEFIENKKMDEQQIKKKDHHIKKFLENNRSKVITTKMLGEYLNLSFPSAIKVVTVLNNENKLLNIKQGVWVVA